jgi:MOSC domain-containing protein YiiM
VSDPGWRLLHGSIEQISISQGGVPKRAVPEAEVTGWGLAGDGHNDPISHGGPERALCLFSAERIEALQAEGHRHLAFGSIGENITTRGIDWDEVQPGVWLKLGDEVVIQVTRFTVPCATIMHFFADQDPTRVLEGAYPGWSRVYARVLSGGVIRPGDPIEVAIPDPAAEEQKA